MSEAARAAEALRAAGRVFEVLLEATRDPYDPGFDVEVAEDVTGAFTADEAVNDFALLRAQAQAGLMVSRWVKAQRNPGRAERVERASEKFADAALGLIRQWRKGEISGDDLYSGVRAAYVRQARVAFTAGKRALGNLEPLTLEDESVVALKVEAEGLTPGFPVASRSLGAMIERLVNSPIAPEEERVADEVDDLLVKHVRAQTTAVMAVAARSMTKEQRLWFAPVVAKQVEKAETRVRKGLSTVRRRLLSGGLTAIAAVALLALIFDTEGERAYRRARATALSTSEPLTDAERAELEATMVAVEEETVAPLRDSGVNWGRLLLIGLVARYVLLDPGVRDWLRDRLGRVKDAYYSLGQAGEMSAFRTGTPAPPPDPGGLLSGAEFAAAPPGPLEERIRVHWVLDPKAENCIDCIRLTDMSPYFLDTLSQEGIYPGSHHTRCWDRCRCRLDFELPVFEPPDLLPT